MNKEILVVDDDEIFCKTIKRALDRDGMKITAILSSKKALEIMRSKQFSAFILDVKMPEMDGFALLKEIKTENPQSQIIMISGMPTSEVVEESINSGARYFIAKPYELDELLSNVKTVLNEQEIMVASPGILVVDDDVSILNAFEEILTENGYSVERAESEKEALEKLDRQKHHIAIIDLILGKSNSMGLIRKIKERSKEIGIIMITGYPSLATEVGGFRSGLTAFLEKPCDREVLLDAVQRGLTNKV